MPPAATSRRAFLASVFTPWRLAPASESPAATAAAAPAPPAAAPGSLVAIVQGRFCLAYQHSFCSSCVERCPVPGAIVLERGLPRVNAAACTGCRICHDVCPAPRNAILLKPKPAAALAVSA